MLTSRSGGSTPAPVMSGRRTLLFAVVGFLAVSNLYWAQPLLAVMAADLGVSVASAGTVVTATQLGYALGILLIVPLGDVVTRRRLIPVTMVCAAVALVACAVAPSFGALLAAATVLGVTTVSGQIALPLAGDLADDATRGHVVASVITGFLMGTVASRTVSGLVADAIGWRSLYAAAAVATLILAVLMHRSIPTLAPRERVRYWTLIGSIGAVVRRHQVVRWTLFLSATQFGIFIMFWTALTFLLSAPPYDYPPSVIGLFGLLGFAGAVAAQRTGRVHDRGWSLPATGLGWALALVAFVIILVGQHSLVLLSVGIVLLHVAIFPLNVLMATRLFGLPGEGRSRINTALVTTNFVAGAIGSAAVGVLWPLGGWRTVISVIVALCAVGLLVWAIGRKGPLLMDDHAPPTSPP